MRGLTMATVILSLNLISALPVSADSPVADGPVIADHLITVADDFIVDVYHNGMKVPDNRRTLLREAFGATAERINIDIRENDWIVFNVVSNRLRWGGSAYFGVTGRGRDGRIFVTDLESGRWSTCDNLEKVTQFIHERSSGAEKPPLAIERPWSDGNNVMNELADGWPGKPIWGQSRNTWIKFVARP